MDTGLVIDSGEVATSVVPIFGGRIQEHASRTLDVGGRTLNYFLIELLRDRYTFHTSFEREIARYIKEELCYVSPCQINESDTFRDNSKSKDVNKRTYKMPDKTTLVIGSEQQICPEVLFNTTLIDLDGESLQHILCNSISKLDATVRAAILPNVLLAGGSTKFQGFESRLINEVSGIDEAYGRSLQFHGKFETRQESSWMGAAMLAQLSQTQEEMMTEEQYYEYGATRIAN